MAFYIWGGVSLYLTYTFLIYCVAVKFNQLFVLYCITLGISFYCFLYFLFLLIQKNKADAVRTQKTNRATAIYFLCIAIIFYFLWLTELLPAISSNTIPQSLITVGLITNPVHVLDLSIVLPGVFITGRMLLKQNNLGVLLAPAILTFFILMDITIGGLTIMLYLKNLTESFGVLFIMAGLTILSLAFLVSFLQRNKNQLIEKTPA